MRALPPPAGTTPVLALTADVFPDTRTRCLDAGVQEVLTKPLSLDGLSAVLARHLGVVAPGPAVLMPLDTATDAARPNGQGIRITAGTVLVKGNRIGASTAEAISVDPSATATLTANN